MNGADVCPGLCFNINYYSYKLKQIRGCQSRPFEAKSSLINAISVLMFM